MTKKLLVAVLSIVGLFAVACGSSGDHSEHDAAQPEESAHEMSGGIPGSPAEPDEGTREIVVKASDELRFDPATLQIEGDDVVTFVVRNVGKTPHEFVLGDEEYQEMHGQDMEGAEHDMEMGNAVSVAPGETRELTWRFEEAGEVLFGCHEPGHYEGGMVGTIEVS